MQSNKALAGLIGNGGQRLSADGLGADIAGVAIPRPASTDKVAPAPLGRHPAPALAALLAGACKFENKHGQATPKRDILTE